MSRPSEGEYAPYFQKYIDQVPEDRIVPVLEAQLAEVRHLLSGCTPEQETFRYAPDKWNVREVVSHLADTDRVFGFRAFTFALDPGQGLPGFDENRFVEASGAAERPLAQAIEEWESVRRADISMFKRLSPDQWGHAGTANGKSISVRALAWISAGHVRHHLAMLAKEYRLRPGA